MSGVSNWTYEYPWGRKAPAVRLEELTRRRSEIERRRKRLEERYRERMIDFERQLEAVTAEEEVVKRCERDRVRRRIREAGFRLLDLGVDIFAEIEASEPSADLLERILEKERNVIAHGPTSPDDDAEDGKNATSSEDGFIDDELVSEDDLRIFITNTEN